MKTQLDVYDKLVMGNNGPMKKPKAHVSTADFKDRLAMIIHGRPRINRHYSSAVVRVPTDKGYYPPSRIKLAR